MLLLLEGVAIREEDGPRREEDVVSREEDPATGAADVDASTPLEEACRRPITPVVVGSTASSRSKSLESKSMGTRGIRVGSFGWVVSWVLVFAFCF